MHSPNRNQHYLLAAVIGGFSLDTGRPLRGARCGCGAGTCRGRSASLRRISGTAAISTPCPAAWAAATSILVLAALGHRVRPRGGRTDDIAHTLAPQTGVGKQVTDRFVKLVVIGLVYRIMVILFRSLLVPVVILFALPLAVIGAFVALAVIGHATNNIIGLAASLYAVALPVAVIAASIWIIYPVGGGLFLPRRWGRT